VVEMISDGGHSAVLLRKPLPSLSLGSLNRCVSALGLRPTLREILPSAELRIRSGPLYEMAGLMLEEDEDGK
jgi:hypothetical protein